LLENILHPVLRLRHYPEVLCAIDSAHIFTLLNTTTNYCTLKYLKIQVKFEDWPGRGALPAVLRCGRGRSGSSDPRLPAPPRGCIPSCGPPGTRFRPEPASPRSGFPRCGPSAPEYRLRNFPGPAPAEAGCA